MDVFLKHCVENGVAHFCWIKGSVLCFGTFCQRVFEARWMGALVFVELQSQSVTCGNNSPRLLDWLSVFVRESKPASVESSFIHLELADHSQILRLHPAGCVARPLKRDMSTILSDFTCKSREIGVEIERFLPLMIEFL